MGIVFFGDPSAGVPKLIGNHLNRSASSYLPRCERVPEIVKANMPVDSSRF